MAKSFRGSSGVTDGIEEEAKTFLSEWRARGEMSPTNDAAPFLPEVIGLARTHARDAIPDFVSLRLIPIQGSDLEAIEGQAAAVLAATLAEYRSWGRRAPTQAQMDKTILQRQGFLRPFIFDAEGIFEKGDYAKIVRGLSDISEGNFVPEELADVIPETGDSEVSFLFRGRQQTIHLQNLGDWVDVGGLLKGINATMGTQGVQSAYWLSHPSGQDVEVWFLEESQAKGLQRRDWELVLPI